jgi:hypothetical protein
MNNIISNCFREIHEILTFLFRIDVRVLIYQLKEVIIFRNQNPWNNVRFEYSFTSFYLTPSPLILYSNEFQLSR